MTTIEQIWENSKTAWNNDEIDTCPSYDQMQYLTKLVGWKGERGQSVISDIETLTRREASRLIHTLKSLPRQDRTVGLSHDEREEISAYYGRPGI